MVVGGAGTTWRNGPHAPALVRRRGCCARSLARHSRLHARRDHLGTWATRFNAIWLLNSAKCAPIKILLAFFQLSCKLKRSTPLAAKRMLLSRCLRPALRDQVRWSLGAVRLGDLCETRFSHVRKFSGGNRRHRKRSRNRSKGNSPAAASSSSNSEVEAGTVDSPAGNSSSTTKKSPWKKTTGYKFLDWMLDLNSDETNRIRSTTEMFFTCLEPAKNPEFYEVSMCWSCGCVQHLWTSTMLFLVQVFGIPNDGSREWFAYHNAAGLHVWLLYRRLKAEERVIESGVREGDLKSLKLFGQELFDRYWEDTLERVRETKVRFARLVNAKISIC